MSFFNDYLLRQIDDMTHFLVKVLFQKDTEEIPLYDAQGNPTENGILLRRLEDLLSQKRVDEGENLLFDALETSPTRETLQVALRFYQQLQGWSEQELKAANFSQDEILQGLAEIERLCLQTKTETGEYH